MVVDSCTVQCGRPTVPGPFGYGIAESINPITTHHEHARIPIGIDARASAGSRGSSVAL